MHAPPSWAASTNARYSDSRRSSHNESAYSDGFPSAETYEYPVMIVPTPPAASCWYKETSRSLGAPWLVASDSAVAARTTRLRAAIESTLSSSKSEAILIQQPLLPGLPLELQLLRQPLEPPQLQQRPQQAPLRVLQHRKSQPRRSCRHRRGRGRSALPSCS